MPKPDGPRKVSLPPNSAREVFAPELFVRYSPVTQDGDILFRFQEFLTENDVPTSVPLGKMGSLRKQIADILPETFADAGTDPVTGADLTQVSGAGLMSIIKTAFDKWYTEFATAPPPPAPSPDPEPRP